MFYMYMYIELQKRKKQQLLSLANFVTLYVVPKSFIFL